LQHRLRDGNAGGNLPANSMAHLASGTKIESCNLSFTGSSIARPQYPMRTGLNIARKIAQNGSHLLIVEACDL